MKKETCYSLSFIKARRSPSLTASLPLSTPLSLSLSFSPSPTF